MADFLLEGVVEFEPSFDRGNLVIPLLKRMGIERKFVTPLGDSPQAKKLKKDSEEIERVGINVTEKPPITKGDHIIANYTLNKTNPENWTYDITSIDKIYPSKKFPMEGWYNIHATFYDENHTPRSNF